jgi:hypothetical protein
VDHSDQSRGVARGARATPLRPLRKIRLRRRLTQTEPRGLQPSFLAPLVTPTWVELSRGCQPCPGGCAGCRLSTAVSHCESPRSAVRLAAIARRARAQPKWAQLDRFARRCPMAAPVEKAVSHSRGPRGVARSLRRASGWRGRPQRPHRARRASGPHPSGEASRVSPHRGLSGAM